MTAERNPADAAALGRLRERLEDLVEEICGDETLVVGDRDTMLYEFPVLRRGEEGSPVTSIPEVWLQEGEWERVRAQLRRTCGA